MRRAAVLALLLACGRIGFQTIAGGSGSAADDARPRDGGAGGDSDAAADAAAAVCPYLPSCAPVMVTCCVAGVSSCSLASQCTGAVISCDVNPPFMPCISPQVCCLTAGSGAGSAVSCQGPPAPC
jgi:hypothetical protein